MKLAIFSLLTLSFFSCTSSHELQLNPDKVIPYSLDSEKKKPHIAPYLAIYTKGSKTLYFLASKHMSIKKFPNLLEHPTLKSIQKIFLDHKPQASVVEGIPTTSELSPKALMQTADRCQINKYVGCGESFFTINQARHFNSEFIGGKPNDLKVLKEIKRQGYTEEDLIYFYITRQIPQLIRQNKFSQVTFPDIASEIIHRYKEKLNLKGHFDFDGFTKWYRKNMPYPKSFYDLKNNDLAPHGGKEGTNIQKIANKITYIRDQNVVNVISELFSQFDRVLVVYGASHLLNQEPVFKEEFDSVKYVKLF